MHDWLLAFHLSLKTVYHSDTPLNLSLSLAHSVFWSKALKRLLKGMLFTKINNLS